MRWFSWVASGGAVGGTEPSGRLTSVPAEASETEGSRDVVESAGEDLMSLCGGDILAGRSWYRLLTLYGRRNDYIKGHLQSSKTISRSQRLYSRRSTIMYSHSRALVYSRPCSHDMATWCLSQLGHAGVQELQSSNPGTLSTLQKREYHLWTRYNMK